MKARVVLGVMVAAASAAEADSWPMRQRDPGHTGRASFSIPVSRQNAALFDALLWQKRSPGSPGSGAFGGSTMVFFDGTGPGGTDIVVCGYHWPKGAQGMDRHTGRLFWTGLPSGGESIGEDSPAFSPGGGVVYVVNDATEGGAWPLGHPLMAFATSIGPSSYWHNGSNPQPGQLSGFSPTIAPDGRIFLHQWNDRPYAGTDTGAAINSAWAAATDNATCFNDPAIDTGVAPVRVVVGGRSGVVKSYNGTTGAELWSVPVGVLTDAPATVDAQTGHIYLPSGVDDVYIVGLTRDGTPLWGDPGQPLYIYQPGINTAQRAQSAGCLSQDGQTFYFQTVSQEGDGRLFAINTASGFERWSINTGGQGWEGVTSSPIVTPNGIVIVGNGQGGAYYAVRDDGAAGTVLDVLQTASGGLASSSATLASDGTLYLPLRTSWTAGNGDGEAPTGNIENLFTAIDLSAGATPTLPPPANQAAFIRNHGVLLTFTPVTDPGNVFDHYAVYRETNAFTSVQGLTPIASVTPRTVTSYLDPTASNGVSYYYAISTVAQGGGQNTQVASIGPRTPRDETDLQVVSIARTPRFERYDPIYTGYTITEPSGFGPYNFSAATGLGSGQTGSTQRWPAIGQQVSYTVTLRNRGTNPWATPIQGRWTIDGQVASQPTQPASLQPGDTTTFSINQTWDDQLHDIQFTILNSDARASNNTIIGGSKSVGYLTYIDRSCLEDYRERTPTQYPSAQTDDLIDWLNRHMTRFNQMFADAGTPKRVHYDLLETLPDNSADPTINTLPFAIFPFRYHAGDGDPRLSGYYDPSEDLDYGLLHEMGHQLGLIDLYQMDISPEMNLVSGRGYNTTECLMRSVAHFLSEHSAHALTHWQNTAHGYFGQYLYGTPDQVQMRFIGLDNQPLAGATVKMYQLIEVPNVGKQITTQIKFQGTTDPQGLVTLPNVPINTQLVPTTFAGDTLRPNPFGYIAVVGSNGVLHFRIERDGFSDYAWLDLPDVNNAYYSGQTQLATFDRHVLLGGVIQAFPPADLAELNAASWQAWAQSASATTADDTTIRTYGQGSVRFETTGGFDTYARYPGDRLARWDLSTVQNIRFWIRAENPNGAFQDGPRVRLNSGDGYLEWSSPGVALNQAIGNWVEYVVPIAGSAQWPRTMLGSPSLAAANSLEIHADTWGYGFTLWLDGVRFDPPLCYANCDNSTAPPILNVGDFVCFQAKFAAQDPYANCDGSTAPPVLNVSDFVCFLQRFAGGCP
jgi:hypothetical protein